MACFLRNVYPGENKLVHLWILLCCNLIPAIVQVHVEGRSHFCHAKLGMSGPNPVLFFLHFPIGQLNVSPGLILVATLSELCCPAPSGEHEKHHHLGMGQIKPPGDRRF